MYPEEPEIKISFKAVKRTVSRGAKTVGRGLKQAAKATGKVTRVIDKVPVVGRPLSLIYGATVAAPVKLANEIASGARIDKAVLGHFKGQLKRIKKLAPYVQTVVSFVPGVGQGVSAAIGAGVALAEGRPLSEAVVAGIRGALPGGPAAQAAFELGRAALSGQRIDQNTLVRVAGGALKLSPTQQQLLVQGLGAATDIARGKKVDQALYDRAQRLLPPAAQQALQVGVAVAQGQKLQTAVTRAVTPQVLAQLQKVGTQVTAKSPVLAAGTKVLRTAAQRRGYSIGAGLVAHKTKAIDLKAVRSRLHPSQRTGFDLAISAYRGLSSKKVEPPSPRLPTPQRFGYYATVGMKAVSKKRRPAVARVIAKDRIIQQGAKTAAVQEPRRVDPRVQRIIDDDPGFDDLFALTNDWQDDQAQMFFDQLPLDAPDVEPAVRERAIAW